MSDAPQAASTAARASRAEAMARDALGRVSARMSILARAVGRPLPPGAPDLPAAGPTAALARLIGLRCDLDSDLRARILGALDQYAEARRLVYSHTGAVPPAALEASVGPLLELHETFAGDPVLGRIFGPDAGRAGLSARRPGTWPGSASAAAAGAGSLLLATLQPGGTSHPGLLFAAPRPGSEPPPRRAETHHLAAGRRAAMPARLGTAVEVDMNLLRAGRRVAFAEAAVDAHRKRIALLEAALEFARTGRSAAHTLAAHPVQGLIRQIALVAANPDIAARMASAVEQFHAAEAALLGAARTLAHAQGLPPHEARTAIGDLAPERIQELIDPLIALSDSFRTHPVLARIFPPVAV